MTDTGDVFIADTGNNRIRRVFSNGTIVTIAGNGAEGFTGDGGPATLARLNQPRSIAYMNGEVFIADSGNNRIRKILIDGTITTIAGSGIGGHCGDNGPAINACITHPVSIVVNNASEVFIADEQSHAVRKIDNNGIISTYAGTSGSSGVSGDGGLASAATLGFPRGLSIGHEGELLIADSGNGVIRKVDKNDIISTVVTGLSQPVAVAVGPDGELFVVEGNKHRISKVDTNGLNMTVAGSPYGTGSSADFHPPEDVSLLFVSSVSVRRELKDSKLFIKDSKYEM